MTDPAPIQEQVINEKGFPTLPWILFFTGLFNGDAGTIWTPTFVNLGQTGTPTFDAKYYRLSRSIVYFRITITPATDTTSTAGSTYIDNFPITFTADGICFAVSGGVGSASGQVVSSNRRIYTPSWSAVTVPLTIVGLAEAQ